MSEVVRVTLKGAPFCMSIFVGEKWKCELNFSPAFETQLEII